MAGFDRFGRKWASAGAVSPPSAGQYDQGFSYLGNTPPSVELFNAMFQERDEQIDWLWQQLRQVLLRGGITPAPTPATQLSDAMNKLFGSRANTNAVFLPGGHIMQWGTGSVVLFTGIGGIGEGSGEILFPVSYPSVCQNVQVSPHDLGGPSAPNLGSSLQETAWVLERNQTRARIAVSARANGIGMSFDWLAIGY